MIRIRKTMPKNSPAAVRPYSIFFRMLLFMRYYLQLFFRTRGMAFTAVLITAP